MFLKSNLRGSCHGSKGWVSLFACDVSAAFVLSALNLRKAHPRACEIWDNCPPRIPTAVRTSWTITCRYLCCFLTFASAIQRLLLELPCISLHAFYFYLWQSMRFTDALYTAKCHKVIWDDLSFGCLHMSSVLDASLSSILPLSTLYWHVAPHSLWPSWSTILPLAMQGQCWGSSKRPRGVWCPIAATAARILQGFARLLFFIAVPASSKLLWRRAGPTSDGLRRECQSCLISTFSTSKRIKEHIRTESVTNMATTSAVTKWILVMCP